MRDVLGDLLDLLKSSAASLRRHMDPESELDVGDAEIVRSFSTHLGTIDLGDLRRVSDALHDGAVLVDNLIAFKVRRAKTG